MGMKNESNLVLEVWDMVRDHIPVAKRLEHAIGIVRAFEEYGMDARDLADIVDEEPYLTRAYNEVFDEEQEAEDGEGYSSEDE
jgi:hypothetical protein